MVDSCQVCHAIFPFHFRDGKSGAEGFFSHSDTVGKHPSQGLEPSQDLCKRQPLLKAWAGEGPLPSVSAHRRQCSIRTVAPRVPWPLVKIMCPAVPCSLPADPDPSPALQVPVLKPMDLMVEVSPRRIFANGHTYHINSISVNSDCETYMSADDLRINLWHLAITDRSFSILAMGRGFRGVGMETGRLVGLCLLNFFREAPLAQWA